MVLPSRFILTTIQGGSWTTTGSPTTRKPCESWASCGFEPPSPWLHSDILTITLLWLHFQQAPNCSFRVEPRQLSHFYFHCSPPPTGLVVHRGPAVPRIDVLGGLRGWVHLFLFTSRTADQLPPLVLKYETALCPSFFFHLCPTFLSRSDPKQFTLSSSHHFILR